MDKVTGNVGWCNWFVREVGVTCLLILGLFSPLLSNAQTIDCPTITNTTQTSVTACTGYIIDSLQVKTSVFWPDKIELIRFNSPQTNPYERIDGVSLGELISSNGIATMRTIAFPPNTDASDKTYYVYGVVTPAPTDVNCKPFALITVTIKASAMATLQAQEASCMGSESAADGWIKLIGYQPTDRYEVSTNGLFSGQNYPIPTDGVVVSHLSRTGNPKTYDVRVYSAFGCYTVQSVMLANIACICLPEKCVPIVIQKLSRGH